jgi:hypothetical protein
MLVDSTSLLRAECPAPPPGAAIVLWDGLNSLLELHQARPSLPARNDLRYLYVGSFADLKDAFPPDSERLFPEPPPPGTEGLLGAPQAPAWVGALSAWRAWARPFKNARLSLPLHRRLQAGGCLVFCGLVRPNAAVLDSFFRGAGLQPLRQRLQTLVDLDWTGPLPSVQAIICRAFDALAATRPSGTQDLAALYAVANVLHRLGTLAGVRSLSPALVVNEFGVQAHFDPYDALAYENNLYIDFGSTRGSDLLYPRTVDLLLRRKPSHALRFLPQGQRLAEFLAAGDGMGFLALCERHAQALIQGLSVRPSLRAA